MTRVKQINFGQLNGRNIIETTMININGMSVASCTYGATITALNVADYFGKIENIVCSFPTVEGYIKNPQFFGATIGPFAGRLENATLHLDGKVFQVPPNEGNHLLHGGAEGFHQAIWSVQTEQTEQTTSTIYELLFDGSYPGELSMQVKFTLTDANELIISYDGTTTATTLLNCTNHMYFNLSGNLKRTVQQHRLTIPATQYIPITKAGLPVGEYHAVEGTVFDFTNGKRLGEVIAAKDEQIDFACGGLDHPFILEGQQIELLDEESGRKLTITSEDKVVVVYTGNKIGADFKFREAAAQNFLGVCLEEQNIPNSSLYSHFPSSILRENERYEKTTIYQFTIEK